MNTPIRNPYTNPNDGPGYPKYSGSLSQLARTGMIITFALAQGTVAVGAILWFIGGGDGDGETDTIYLAVGFAATLGSCLVAGFVPPLIRSAAVSRFRSEGNSVERPIDTEAQLSDPCARLVGGGLTASLIGQAAMEGAAIINLILMFIGGGNLIHVGLAVVGLIGIAMLTPTLGRLTTLVEQAAE